MRIGLAQIAPVSGDIDTNISLHLEFIDLAIEQRAEMVVFPELSITGYEPTLAANLATTPHDSRFAVLQKKSNEHNLVIAVGMPLRNDNGITISLVFFQPNKEPLVYSKQFLHSDEEPFFVSGSNDFVLVKGREKIAPAICYELSVPEHAEAAFGNGAKIYLTSVAKTADGVTKAHERLSSIAKQYSMTALMVNCLGSCDGVVCSGRSAVWNNKGELLAQLDVEHEGVLLFDTETMETFEKYF